MSQTEGSGCDSAHGPKAATESIPGVKSVIAVGAGKGGVGKSTAAVLLALGLRRQGASVGILDADIYGPSIPTMLGVADGRPVISDDKSRMTPVDAQGIKVISIGFMVNPSEAVVWRGPMVHGVVTQFLRNVDWGELDYLVVDLPPGTGDVPLTLSQAIPITGSVVICTPQDIALHDAVRAVRMYEMLNIPSLGLIENMSYYVCPKCGNRDEVFSSGGVKAAAEKIGVPYLGEIPLNAGVRAFGDQGNMEENFTGGDKHVREALESIISATNEQLAKRAESPVDTPKLTIE